MRILMIAPGPIQVPPARGGSVEICMTAIARYLALGHDVVVASRLFSGQEPVLIEGRLTMRRVTVRKGQTYIHSVMETLREEQFDRIQIDNRPGYIPVVKRWFPYTPISIFLHSLTYTSAGKRTTARLSRADLIIANSISLKNRLGSRFPKLSSRIHTIHLGVDFDRFRPPLIEEREYLRQQAGLTGAYSVLFAGRVVPRKGLEVLLRAVQRLRRQVPSAVLVVAGSNGRWGYGKRIRHLAKVRKVPIKFLGNLPHQSMHTAYWLADCFVCPSQKHEAFGLVNVEAMASGLPCVASANGGIPEIIQHERNGYLVVDYNRALPFAKYMSRLALEPEKALMMAQTARNDMQLGFGWHRTAEALSQIYGSWEPLIQVMGGEVVGEACGEQVEENGSLIEAQ
ncbi:MAG: glycosyltransferase family 4 protein [Gorillibacterium sp.]|nr:glycosyltransferase family 4 protein [Gorillibacterium sp.]